MTVFVPEMFPASKLTRFSSQTQGRTAAAVTDPNRTDITPWKPVPVIVTDIPPLALPLVIDNPVTTGVETVDERSLYRESFFPFARFASLFLITTK